MEPSLNQANAYSNQPKKRNVLSRVVFAFFFLAVIGLSIGVGFLYFEYKKSQEELEKLKDPTYYSQIQDSLANVTVEKLKKIMILPEGEEPTIATVIKDEELRKENPEFYGDVVNGDQIIMYSNRLVIYRESENIIVNASYFPAGSLEEASQESEDTSSEDQESTEAEETTEE